MGGAAFFVLKGCSDSSDVDNDGDGTFYATVQDCIDDGNNADICARGWNNAKTAFYADVPKNMTQQNCQSKYENCYYRYNLSIRKKRHRPLAPTLSIFVRSDCDAVQKDYSVYQCD